MTIETLKIEKLKPASYNPRKNLQKGDAEYEKIKKSIQEFGYVEPIIVNADFTIIGGHQRYKVLKDLGFKDIQCVVLDLDKTKEKALNIALNKISGEFDIILLKDLLQDLDTGEIDLTLTGFYFNEIENMLTQFNIDDEIIEDDFDLDKSIEEIKEPITKKGDIWKLGNHRLMCGDSTNENNIKKLINNNIIDMILTDPPYDMQMGGQGCFASSTKNVKKRIDKIINFDPYILTFLPDLNVLSYYIFTSKDGIPKYLEIFKNHNFNILIWCKTNPTPFTSGTFLPDIEYIMFFSKKNNKIWNNSLKPTEIYKKYYISSKTAGRNDDNVGNAHPTIKPQDLLINKIKISSKVNGYVLDLFGGSGSTLIACEQSQRNCIMIELDGLYCDVIVKRWETLTGKKAELIEKGDS